MGNGSTVRRETYPEGTVLFHHGEAGEKAYYIEDGRVSIVRQGETIAVLGAGDIVGEMALIDDRPRTATAACAAECRLLTVERDYLHDAMARADPALPYILRMVLKRFRRVMALTDGGFGQVPATASARIDGVFADRLRLEEELRSALETDRYFLAVQPVVDLAAGETVGVEALLRLDHPEYGVLMPADFMALAEERGLVVEIGRWVLQAAAEIAREHADRWSFVSVNVAARQLDEGDLVTDVDQACRRAGIEPGRLALEVTEMGIVERPEYAAVLLERVSALGCRIAIDDFGTGTSSFSQLHRLPFDVLKIDRSLVAALPESERARKIARAIGRMGAELDLEVIAEGIETERQWTLAREAGCGLGQGYHVERPEYAAVLLERVSALGCRIAIDDFGTGTSSFSQLHRLPFDVLKIDRSLVAALPESERARKIARAIGRMGAELDLEVIAEGIETERQWTLAREAGCGLGQGYHFARPARPQEIAGRG